ncbi:MAG: DUF72 domain-containing protein [Bryobacteraceae bacterium]
MELRVGTSGWHYPHWREHFYPPDVPATRRLEYYSQRFDTVEINNSFYRLPKPETMREWRDKTPAGFLFAVKGSRFITHNKKLKDPEGPIERLLPVVDELGKKLGPILFQLPPGWKVSAERLAHFLDLMPKGYRCAFEFREPSWENEDIYGILKQHNAAVCIFHLAGYESPIQLTADFTYIRLHGPVGKYQGSYSNKQLREWVDRIQSWKRKLKAAYVYFDNDVNAAAVKDAERLRKLLGISGGGLRRAA